MTSAASTRPEEVSVSRIAFRLSASLDHRPLAIDLVSCLAAHVVRADRSFRHEIVTAFSEAFNNIVIHAYRGRSDGMLDIEVELCADSITLKLMDEGLAVNFGGLKPPDLDSMPERGMGVFMIHALVDEVVYQSGRPNVLSLVKRASSTPREGVTRDELHPNG
jgi:serine/threonine-protein kinase RsbW